MATRIEIYAYNGDTESYDLQATYYPDGTVEGTAGEPFVVKLEWLVDQFDRLGEDPRDHYDSILERLRKNWNTAPYDIVWYE